MADTPADAPISNSDNANQIENDRVIENGHGLENGPPASGPEEEEDGRVSLSTLMAVLVGWYLPYYLGIESDHISPVHGAFICASNQHWASSSKRHLTTDRPDFRRYRKHHMDSRRLVSGLSCVILHCWGPERHIWPAMGPNFWSSLYSYRICESNSINPCRGTPVTVALMIYAPADRRCYCQQDDHSSSRDNHHWFWSWGDLRFIPWHPRAASQ